MLGQHTFFTIKVLVKSHFGPQTLILYKLILQLLICLFYLFGPVGECSSVQFPNEKRHLSP